MNRTRKYAIGFGITSLLIHGMAGIVWLFELPYLYVSAAIISLPGDYVSSLLYGDVVEKIVDQRTGILSVVCFNILLWSIVGMLLAWATPPLTARHRKRIRRYGYLFAGLSGTVTLTFILLVTNRIIDMHNDSPFFFLFKYFMGLGEMQIVLDTGDIYFTRVWVYKVNITRYIYYNVPMHTVAGLLVGCLIAAFTARWARFPTKNGCPKCNYNLTGTPEYCPECGWEKDVKTPINAVT